MKKKHFIYLSIAGVIILSSCGGGGEEKTVEEPKTENGIEISDVEMKEAEAIYFDRCAGCHGSARLGATGPHLLPEAPEGNPAPGTKVLGVAGLKAFIENGTPAGMPEWKGIMTDAEIELMTRFLQVDPPIIPPFGMTEMTETWNLIIPVAERPTTPQHKRNIDNYFWCNYERCW